jgi:hypothetical protein
MANVRKQKRSPLLMRYLLGCDGDDAMHNAQALQQRRGCENKRKRS